MDCEAFHTELPELVYGELGPVRVSAANAHAGGCPACQCLLDEVQAVRGSLPSVLPPANLGTRLKLAARDHLLDEPTQPGSLVRSGSALHVAATAILGGCVIVAAFAMGRAYERKDEAPPAPGAPEARKGPAPLPVPGAPEEARLPDEPEWIEIRAEGLERAPKSAQAWQRVLFDAGQRRQRKGESKSALRYFLRSAAVAPQGPLAAPARVSAAEALLGLKRKEEALAELKQVRQEVRGGTLPGSPALLQRIGELVHEAER